MKQFIVLLVFGVCGVGLRAQEVAAVVKDKVRINGGLSANQTFYTVRGIENRRDPFYWAINGNLNINIGQLALPFSVTFNQQEIKFVRPQPFNQFGVSPKYKWITVHAGYRTLQFSELTLAGNMFLGTGIELQPDNYPLEFRAVYGRFSRAIRPDNAGFFNSQPAFERWGYGAKVTLKKKETVADIIVFRAKDRAHSLDSAIAKAAGITPAENLVMGFNVRTRINHFSFDLQYAFSAYTRDSHAEEVVLNTYSYLNNLGQIYMPRASTQVNGAIINKIGYSGNSFQLDLTYRRIGPDYRTMGSTFLNNDLRDITLNVAKPFFENKIQLSAGGGVQKNNLDNTKQIHMHRLVGNANCTYTPTSRLNFNINYANFSTQTRQSAFTTNTYDQIDSLFYLQVTNNAGFSVSYNPGKSQSISTLVLNTNYQKARDNNAGNSQFYNINFSDQLNFTNQKLTLNAGINFSQNIMPSQDHVMVGPALSVVKSVKEIRLTLSGTWQQVYNNEILQSVMFNSRLNCQATVKKKSVFGVDFSYLARNTKSEGMPGFHEWRAGINYRYSFNIL
jgi:hypothetical protein